MGIVKVTNSMDYQSVITNLREKIFRELIPIVNGNYYHLDNPYHINIGDNLIWEGEKQFLKQISVIQARHHGDGLKSKMAM